MISPVTADKVCTCGATSGNCYIEGHSHSYSCPEGYSATNSWGNSAQTASKVCSCGATSGTCYKAPAHTHSYSCPSGYQESSCSSSQVQTGTTSKVCSCGEKSGTCYTCRAKTCREQGKKDCNGTCIDKSKCCGSAPSDRPYCVSGDWNECSQSELDDMDYHYNKCPGNVPYPVKCAGREYFCMVWCCPNSGTQCATVKTTGGCFTMY